MVMKDRYRYPFLMMVACRRGSEVIYINMNPESPKSQRIPNAAFPLLNAVRRLLRFEEQNSTVT